MVMMNTNQRVPTDVWLPSQSKWSSWDVWMMHESFFGQPAIKYAHWLLFLRHFYWKSVPVLELHSPIVFCKYLLRGPVHIFVICYLNIQSLKNCYVINLHGPLLFTHCVAFKWTFIITMTLTIYCASIRIDKCLI